MEKKKMKFDDGAVSASVSVGSAVEDPLSNRWGLSLFPPLLPSTNIINPHDPNQDLHHIHTHLKSMALANPSKLHDEAKSIRDANPELFSSQIPSVPASIETNDVVPEESQHQEFPRKLRPALGLKRGHFTLRPSKTPTLESLLPPLDLDKLKDPVEYFKAHERREIAEREIWKQLGIVSVESNEDNISTKTRQRRQPRPGLPGNNQRQVKYKHRYQTETLVNNDYVPSSQGAIGNDSVDPVGENTDKGGACHTSLENEVTDLSDIEEEKVNNILDELLCRNPEDLEGGGAMALLEEKLQIKPIDIRPLSVPDFPNIPLIDLKSMPENLTKPRKALSNIDNWLKGMKNKTPLKQDVGYPVQQSASPTPPRSPFAALSSLQKHISRSKPSVDPFSAHEIDHLSSRDYPPTNTIRQELDLVGSRKPSNEVNASITEDVIAVSMTSSGSDTVRNCTGTSGKSKEDNPGRSPDKVNVPLTEVAIDVSGRTSVEDSVRNRASTSQKSLEDTSRESEFDAIIDSKDSHVHMDVDIGGSGVDVGVMNDTEGRPNIEANGPCEFENIIQAENMQGPAAFDAMDDLDLNSVNRQDQSNPAGFQASAIDKSTGRTDEGLEQSSQEKMDGSLKPVNGQRKAKLRSQRQSESRRLSRRQSLAVAGAGSSWKGGVRRSTRNRTRPLEYWKGERPVYGRIHDSLTTVIGVKCMSPGSDGKPTMKVKSYVGDEYKELLEFAALG
ncbi:hypothetical protein RIF29_28188 [Crotalaria pallida]|uniref:Uncharacterized protein n=1 Tax=Crotalaria pallida TaxID=3830 RepID=A0AAN9I352_CROPI